MSDIVQELDDVLKSRQTNGYHVRRIAGQAMDEIKRLCGRLDEEDRAADQLIRERDHAESMADKLATALATLLGVEIGEHSSANCPWTEALDAFAERPADQPTDALEKFARDLAAAQTPLDQAAAKVLRENLHDLYMDGGTSDNGSAG